MKPQVSIIIPARAESEIIISTLQSLSSVVVPHDIIVASDRIDSMDKTEAVVSNYADHVQRIRLIQKRIGKDVDGFAGALLRGVWAAKTPYVVFVMADLCDDPKTIDVMHGVIQKGWDVVCGSRYMQGGKKLEARRLKDFFRGL